MITSILRRVWIVIVREIRLFIGEERDRYTTSLKVWMNKHPLHGQVQYFTSMYPSKEDNVVLHFI